MDANRFLIDELSYVLYVNECPISNTVAGKKVALTNALKMEEVVGT